MRQHALPLTDPLSDTLPGLRTPDEALGAAGERDQPQGAVPGRPAVAIENAYVDWRKRLSRNLSRRSDGRWDPLTYPDDPGPR